MNVFVRELLENIIVPPKFEYNGFENKSITSCSAPIVARAQFSIETSKGYKPFKELIYTGNSVDEVVQKFSEDQKVLKREHERASKLDGEFTYPPTFDRISQLIVNGRTISRGHSWFSQLERAFNKVVK